mmetsp:Transcript_44234/g.102185  ORF Transcript_44234/g.102185 Transcript_44234/m.102185 type:complete len:1001 (-) Transcript_44234:91-3093(-)
MAVYTPVHSQVDTMSHLCGIGCEAQPEAGLPIISPHFTMADLQQAEEPGSALSALETIDALLAPPDLSTMAALPTVCESLATEVLVDPDANRTLEQLPREEFVDDEDCSDSERGDEEQEEGDEVQTQWTEVALPVPVLSAPPLDIGVISAGLSASEIGRGTDEKLLLRRAALRQMRADYKLRLERSRELEAEVLSLDKEIARIPDTLGKRLADMRESLAHPELVRCKAALQSEDRLAHTRRLLSEQLQQEEVMKRRLQSLQESRSALEAQQSGSASSEDPALLERRRQAAALKDDAAAQDKKFNLLKADLRALLDFMMRVNIEASGGPSKQLASADFLSQEVIDRLRLSSHGHLVLQKLVRKYEAFMSTCATQASERVNDTISLDPALGPAEALSTPKGRPSVSSSIEEEAFLLRSRLSDEMERVAKVLSASDAGVPSRARRQRELLRVAAWGDGAALRKLLSKDASASASSADTGTRPGGDALCGWTSWHAAAAHGQRSMIEVLKEVASAQGQDSLSAAIERATASGWTPLGVACMQGHAEAVDALLQAKASVNARDTRGNPPLMCAAAAEAQSQTVALVKLLVEAGADLTIRNDSGLALDPELYSQLLPDTSGGHSSLPEAAEPTREEAVRRLDERSGLPKGGNGARSSQGQYHCVMTLSDDQPEEPRAHLLSLAAAALAQGYRDTAGVQDNAAALEALQLTAAEEEQGLWSSAVLNYSHAGLEAMLSTAEVRTAPLTQQGNQQVLVLTCDRLLLLQFSSWSLLQVMSLADVTGISRTSYSEHVIVLHSRATEDVLLDVVMCESFLEGIKIASAALARHWGGSEYEERDLPVTMVKDEVQPLCDEKGERAGTMAWLEANTLLLLPYEPQSLLLTDGTVFFGFLDLSSGSIDLVADNAWQVYFFVLKVCDEMDSRLHWCHHPNDAESLRSIAVRDVRLLHALTNSEDEPCMTIEAAAPGTNEDGGTGGCMPPVSLLLRAKSARNRDDWLASIRAQEGES